MIQLAVLRIGIQFGAGPGSAVVGLLAGISGVLYGVLSKKFLFHGRFGSRAPEKAPPTFLERSIVVLVSATVALASLFRLIRIS